MNGSIVLTAVVAAVIGLGAGYGLYPYVAGPAEPQIVKPTSEEATAALRRYRNAFGSFEKASVKLGDCSPGTLGPGVMCMSAVILDTTVSNATHQNRPVGFARVNGQWEVAIW